MEDVQNANPTILDASELPTRRRRQSSTDIVTKTSIAFAYPPPVHSADPFSPSSKQQDESNSDVDSEPEPIDEQEIYDLISTMSDPEHPITLGSTRRGIVARYLDQTDHTEQARLRITDRHCSCHADNYPLQPCYGHWPWCSGEA